MFFNYHVNPGILSKRIINKNSKPSYPNIRGKEEIAQISELVKALQGVSCNGLTDEDKECRPKIAKHLENKEFNVSICNNPSITAIKAEEYGKSLSRSKNTEFEYNEIEFHTDIKIGDFYIELKLGPKNNPELQRLIGQILIYKLMNANYAILLCDYTQIGNGDSTRREAYINTIKEIMGLNISKKESLDSSDIERTDNLCGLICGKGKKWERIDELPN